jgi:biotin-[acetyl-CoA-carboxylase] ligase BirA-like protein
VPSTNDFLLAKTPPPVGQLGLCIAAHQTQGRGQRGRVWQAQLGHGFWFSLAWQGLVNRYQPGPITQLYVLAVVDALCAMGVKEVSVKWPNDLYIGHAKVGGVLLETSQQANRAKGHFVLGMGINWHVPDYLDRSVTGLASQVHSTWSYHQVMVGILQRCIVLHQQMQGDMQALLHQLPARWQAHELRPVQ